MGIIGDRGARDIPEYTIWANMIYRCTNANHEAFHRYGGRGITVCERWRSSFKAFYEDMGPRPSLEHSLDRRDNDGNYEPGNVRWATAQEQSENSSTPRFVEHNGRQISVSELSRQSGVKITTLFHRLNSGQTPEQAISSVAEYDKKYCYNGESLTLRQWADKLGLSYGALHARLRRGWDIEKALSTPNPRNII